MAVDQSEVESFIYSSLEKVKRNGVQSYVARCPICGDSKRNPYKRRLHIDYYSKYDEWIYTCYNGGCNESGNIQSLYMHLNNVDFKTANDVLTGRKYNSDKLKKKLDKDKTVYVDEVDPLTTTLDLDLSLCYSVKDKPEGIQGKKYVDILTRFIVDRRIPTRYKPLICFEGKYENRIIIPVYEGNEMIYFQGRKIFDFMEPKYLNPDVVKESIILNRENFDKDKYIIVTEGLACAMNIGNQGTSCLGATISDDFLRELYKYTNKGVILALDNPLLDESGYKNYIKIIEGSSYAKKVKYFFMPGKKYKDINDLCVDNPVSFLPKTYDFIVENSVSYFKANFLIKNL
jgi:hypothetical protein